MMSGITISIFGSFCCLLHNQVYMIDIKHYKNVIKSRRYCTLSAGNEVYSLCQTNNYSLKAPNQETILPLFY